MSDSRKFLFARLKKPTLTREETERKALGRKNVDEETVKALAKSFGGGEINRILNEAKSAPEWIYGTAMRVQEEQRRA